MIREFKLLSVEQVSMARIRVRYTQFPYSADDQGVNDATNPVNYTLAGPGSVIVKLVKTLSEGPDVFELWLSAELTVGTWNLTVSNVKTSLDETLTVSSIQFAVSQITDQSGGLTTSQEEDILHKNFSPAFNGKAWDAVITSLAVGDSIVASNTQLAFDQMFVSSASGRYLNRKTGDVGISRPVGVGMADELFRRLSIIISNQKLTQESVLEVLEIFYGSENLRSWISSIKGPFAFTDGDWQDLLVDGKRATVTFRTGDFTNIGIASATETAAVFNRSFQNIVKAFAKVHTDVDLGQAVRLYSGLGLASSIVAVGGRGQNVLQFPQRITVYIATAGALPTWNITTIPTEGRLRFTVTGPTGLDLSTIREGDFVNIYGNEFQSDNRGTFTVVKVYVAYPLGILTQYFEIVNRNGVAQLGLAQVADESIFYFRPVKSITSKRNGVSVLQGDGVLNVNLPVTTQAVNRGYLTAAYLHENPELEVNSIVRNKDGLVTIDAPLHGLLDGQQIEIIEVFSDPTTPATVSGGPGVADASVINLWSNTTASAIDRRDHSVIALDNFHVLVAGGYSDGMSTRLSSCELFTITGSTVVSGAVQYSYTLANTGSMLTALEKHKSILSHHPSLYGKVLLTGGWDGAAAQTACELYSGTWAATGSMNAGRYSHTINELIDNRIMVTGGETGVGVLASCEIFNPSSSAWTTINPMSFGRTRHTATVLQDGSVLVCGGLQSSGIPSARCEKWNVLSGNWEAVGGMSWTRAKHAAVLLDDGRVLVVGGVGFLPRDGSGADQSIVECEIFDPKTNFWLPAGRLRYARSAPSLSKFGTKVMVIGGGVKESEVLDTRTMEWSLSATMPNLRDAGDVATLGNGLIYMANGTIGLTTSQSTNMLFVPASERASAGGLTGMFPVTIPDGNTITIQTPNHKYFTNLLNYKVYPVKAASDKVNGPYIFDPTNGLGITAKSTTLAQSISHGIHYQYLDLVDATQLPDQNGWLCIGFGTEYHIAPIQYFGRLSNTRIKVDYRFVFPFDIPSGTEITFITNKGIFIPENVPSVGGLYVTGSNAGVVAVSGIIDDLVAGGIFCNKQIVYPGDRGLGGEGLPVTGPKIADKVWIWGSDDLAFT